MRFVTFMNTKVRQVGLLVLFLAEKDRKAYTGFAKTKSLFHVVPGG